MAEVIDYGDAKDEATVQPTDVEDDGLGGLSSAKEVRKRTRKVRRHDEQVDADLIAVLQSAEGRRLVAWILVEGEYGNDPFHTDPAMMARNCGIQELPRKLMTRLLRPETAELYNLLLKENAGMKKEMADG